MKTMSRYRIQRWKKNIRRKKNQAYLLYKYMILYGAVPMSPPIKHTHTHRKYNRI